MNIALQKFMATNARRIAGIVPLPTIELLCDWISSSPDLANAHIRVCNFAHSQYRDLVAGFITDCAQCMPMPTPSEVALCLFTASHSDQAQRDEQSVEIVWTGPDPDVVPLRRTEQALLQTLESAREQITLVSYAVYKIPNVREALVKAAQRGVRLTVVIETPDRIEGQNEYSTLQALGDAVANCARVYYWPAEMRRISTNGKLGIMHVKCAVADGRWLFLSSANLTEYAFDINMELGVLVTGGQLPDLVQRQFNRLIQTGVLQPI